MNDDDVKNELAVGPEETQALLRQLLEKAERGELGCTALRLFHADGTHEDVVLGARSATEREEALAHLRKMYDKGH